MKNKKTNDDVLRKFVKNGIAAQKAINKLTEQKRGPVRLTVDDWVEIAAALDTKLNQIENGDLGGENHLSSPNGCQPDCEACENERWTRHLRSISQIIGPDGENAAKLGVMVARP